MSRRRNTIVADRSVTARTIGDYVIFENAIDGITVDLAVLALVVRFTIDQCSASVDNL